MLLGVVAGPVFEPEKVGTFLRMPRGLVWTDEDEGGERRGGGTDDTIGEPEDIWVRNLDEVVPRM